MTATYIYAIISKRDEGSLHMAGVKDVHNSFLGSLKRSILSPLSPGPKDKSPDGPTKGVHAITERDLTAVVSGSPLADYRGLKRDEAAPYLVAHQRVVETLMPESPVLPVIFGTVLPDEDHVRHLLTQGEDLFRTSLEQFAGLKQMEVAVLWDLERVFQEIGQEEHILRLKSQIAGLPPEETTVERVAIGKLVQGSLEERRQALQDRLLPPLREVSQEELVINPLMDDHMAANVGLLVDEAGEQALDQQLHDLDEAFGGQLTLRCVGPLPPYSFASVAVKVPSFDAIDEARRRLGLEERATPDEIKRAYHRVASELHPDHNIGDPKAKERMAEASKAYALLTAYAANVQRSRTAEERGEEQQGKAPLDPSTPAPRLSFSRESVKQTLLITIKRQE
jgi:DnaJ-domain-containing protein 1